MTSGATVLVIDDTESSRKATVAEFEEFGCTVLTASCPASGIGLLQEGPVSLVLVNPRITGAVDLITAMSSALQERSVIVMAFSPFEPTGSDGGWPGPPG